ncbi:MAG: hypothetical protein IJA75_10555 [Oscillospiraceae bacterium]|nr:hypothetical protein [Oscillospiraceae bacterium]
MADWQAIKTEYITGNISYRTLAEKYGVSCVQISRVGKAEGWVERRAQYREKTLTKTLDRISRQQADREARILGVADKILQKIESMVDAEEPMDSKGIRALTAAVKELKDIQNVRSELDRKEQEARIANLRRQADKQSGGAEVIEVVFAAGPEEWNE